MNFVRVECEFLLADQATFTPSRAGGRIVQALAGYPTDSARVGRMTWHASERADRVTVGGDLDGASLDTFVGRLASHHARLAAVARAMRAVIVPGSAFPSPTVSQPAVVRYWTSTMEPGTSASTARQECAAADVAAILLASGASLLGVPSIVRQCVERIRLGGLFQERLAASLAHEDHTAVWARLFAVSDFGQPFVAGISGVTAR